MKHSFYRIWTVVLRSWYSYKRDFNKTIDFTFWPLIDLVIYGFMGVAFANQQSNTSLLIFFTAILLWQVVYRTNLEISRTVLQELWDNNIANVLSTPLTVGEWFTGLMLLGILALFFTIPFALSVIWLLFGYCPLTIGMPLLLYIFLLAWSGWILGILGSGCLFYKGQAIETLVWALGWVFTPFCAVYYPEHVLPSWAQTIGSWLPMTHVFRALRLTVSTGAISASECVWAIVLNIVYMTLVWYWCMYMLRRRKNEGLASW